MLSTATRLRALTLTVFLMSAVLVGCGSAGCASSSPRGPATVSSGPVTIALDHSIYAPDSAIQVTVTNRSRVGVMVFWHITLNCLPFYLSPQRGSSTGLLDEYCYTTEADAGYRNQGLASGSSISYTIGLASTQFFRTLLSPGTYRLVTPWAVVTDHDVAISTGQAMSEPFRICTCATCS
jgi:hypothetical protein